MIRHSIVAKILFVSVLIQVGTAKGDKSPQEIFADLDLATSNAWGCSKSTFDVVAQSNMAALASIGTAESSRLRAQWLMNLSRMSMPADDLQYVEWLNVKVRWLVGSGRYFADAGFTNLWFAASDVLGDLRRTIRSRTDIMANHRLSETNGALTVSSGCPAGLMNALGVLDAQRDSAAMLSRLIVDTYGRRGLKGLDESSRPSIVSNLIIRAQMTVKERDILLGCMAIIEGSRQ